MRFFIGSVGDLCWFDPTGWGNITPGRSALVEGDTGCNYSSSAARLVFAMNLGSAWSSETVSPWIWELGRLGGAALAMRTRCARHGSSAMPARRAEL